MVVVGPDGQPVGTIPASALREQTLDEDGDPEADEARHITDLVEQPAKVMRIGSMIRQLLEEVKAAPARRGQPAPAQGDPPGLDQGARDRAGPRAGRGAGAAVAAVHRGGHALRGRAADRPGPAGRLARGSLPRHPDRDLRPADGGPGAARADASRAAARRDAGPARRRRGRRAAPAAVPQRRHVPLGRRAQAGRRRNSTRPSSPSRVIAAPGATSRLSGVGSETSTAVYSNGGRGGAVGLIEVPWPSSFSICAT